MSSLFPSLQNLQQGFGARPGNAPPPSRQPAASATPYQAPLERYHAYSVVDNAKDKAQKLSAEAQAEFDKASSAAQAKAGPIELFSPKYYAACTFGGLLACVSRKFPSAVFCVVANAGRIGADAHGCHAAGSGEMSSPGRLQAL